MPLFTIWIRTSTLKMILARHARFSPRWTSASWTLPSRCIGVEDSGERAGCAVSFARLFVSCQKLQLSPFEHCPLFATANNLLFLCEHNAVPSDSWPKCLIPISGLKVPRSQILLNTSLDHCLQSARTKFRLLLMNLQVVQFSHGLKFFQTLVFSICTDFPVAGSLRRTITLAPLPCKSGSM